MVSKEFMSEVFWYKKLSLGDVEERFLGIICSWKSVSAYDVFSIQKKLKPMNYRNVHTRLKRLKQLGLIEIDTNIIKVKRNAIKYRITSRGVFQLMLSNYFIPSIMNKYSDNLIMKTLVYEYFEPLTIKKFITLPRFRALNDYLRECCEAILKRLEQLREPNPLLYQIQYERKEYEFTEKSLAEVPKYFLLEIKQVIVYQVRKFLFQIISISKIRWNLIDHDPNSPHSKKIRIDDDPDETDEGPNYASLFPIPALNQDKKFIHLLKEVKYDFDLGCRNFL
jgi:hypothetical protein